MEQRQIRSIRAFLGRGDSREAWLSARDLFQRNPKNGASCRLLAEMADAARSPEAILWWEKLVELSPGAPGPLLELAACATRAGEAFIAGEALEKVPEDKRNTLAYHAVAGALAIKMNDSRGAELHFEAALKLEPTNEPLKLNLETLRLGVGTEAAAGEARKAMEVFRKNPAYAQVALRALVTDARRRGDSSQALGLATELRKFEHPTLDDRLLYLEELRHAQAPSFEGELKSLQEEVIGDPGKLYGLMTWMNANAMAERTAAWIDVLPARICAQSPVPLAVAETYAALRNWKRLKAVVANGNWQGLEFLRLAIQSRVLFEMADEARSPDFALKWNRAVVATGGDPNALAMLARLAGGWNWRKESAQVWWMIAGKNSGQRHALEELYRMASEDKNTQELYRVAHRVYEVEPKNPAARNNVAMLALLLGVDLPEAHSLAAAGWSQFPFQPGIASTYAFSLHLQTRTQEGLAILAKLPEAELRQPNVACCYGVLLAADGQGEKAAPYLAIAAVNEKSLLPEELGLVKTAIGK